MTNETNSKNATPRTKVNEKKRSLTMPQMPRPGLGATSQTVFSADCSSPNTPDAPNNRTTTPTMMLTTPDPGACAFLAIDSTAPPAPTPTTPDSWPEMCCLAASSPNASPATATARMINGAIDSSV